MSNKLMKRVHVRLRMAVLCVLCMLSAMAVADDAVRIRPGNPSLLEAYLTPQSLPEFQAIISYIETKIPNKEACNYNTTFNWGDD